VLFQSANLRVEMDSFALATLWLDVQGERYNVLNRAVLDELDQAIQAVKARHGVAGLIIRSAKETGFLAGADVHQFTTIRSPDEARALSARGQEVFQQLADLSPKPVTLALVEGPCLGGGLELALSCTYRFAVDQPGTLLGFPEVELGLLPGWGGTQRLPRNVGLEHALPMILGGRKLNAWEAHSWGLVDRVLDPEEVTGRLAQMALDLIAEGPPVTEPHRPVYRSMRQWLIQANPVGRWLFFRGAERVLKQRVPDDMPAPHEALRAVRIGQSRGIEAGLAYEREAAARLATTPACRHLVGLFLQREAARKVPAELRDAVQPVRRVGIVGAGAMGAGIAQLAAFKDCSVVVQEINESALGGGLLKVAGLFHKAVERGLLRKDEAERKLSGVHGTNTWKGFDDVDLVVEAVVEDLEVKRQVFRELEARTRPTAVLATNTSSLSVARLQEGLAHPERVAALHFFNPVHKMPLVEVAHTPRTDRRTTALLVQWAITLGKTPVLVKESPGFVVNRVLMPYLSEAAVLVAQKLPVGQIDQIMRRFGMPMGPLELLDQIGLDVAAHVARTIFEANGPPEEVSYAASVARLFEALRQAGWLGQKSAAGFYVYRGKARRVNAAAAQALAALSTEEAGESVDRTLLHQPGSARDRLVLPMVNAAAACLGEGVAASAEAIDLAMVLGTGWAPHRGGPLHYADDRGSGEIVRVLEGLSQRFGPWFAPCAELRRRAEEHLLFCRGEPGVSTPGWSDNSGRAGGVNPRVEQVDSPPGG
jgi:3-hydroxyacyl-CoA dehydrogenase/enoyl-CoA hydratase/3-hydroxybutyryl-CoA epimerase